MNEGLNPLSLTTHYLRMISYGSEDPIATGSGFIYEFNSKYYLITNGHNVTRINPETGERITNTAAFPIKIRMSVRIRDENVPNKYALSNLVTVFLYEQGDDEFTTPKWYVHPIYGYNVDVIAILIEEISKVPDHIAVFPINKIPFDREFPPRVADDIFILGYPFDITGGMELPIWKRGTISTEPNLNIDNLPKFLVDSSTRPGMSGAPVIMQRIGVHGMEGGVIKGKEFIGSITNFAGIYSGRIGAEDNLKTQLGIVWKPNVIEEILQGKVIGSIDFQVR